MKRPKWRATLRIKSRQKRYRGSQSDLWPVKALKRAKDRTSSSQSGTCCLTKSPTLSISLSDDDTDNGGFIISMESLRKHSRKYQEFRSIHNRECVYQNLLLNLLHDLNQQMNTYSCIHQNNEVKKILFRVRLFCWDERNVQSIKNLNSQP